MKKTKKAICWGISLAFLLLSFIPSPLWAGNEPPAEFTYLETMFESVIQVVLTLAGLAVLVMLITGGFQYLTAADDPKKAQQAGKTLTGAVIGLVVVLGAWIILRAIALITGFNVTTFRIPQ